YPVQNTTANIENVMEGVNCVTQNVKAVAKEMKERAGHAIGEAVPMDKLRDLMTAQSMPFENVKKTLKKVDEALGKMMKWQKSLIDKINGLMKNCSALAQIPFKACIGWLEERHKDCFNSYPELICKPIELIKGICYATKILEIHCNWPGKVKSAVKEGVGKFVKNSKQRIINYTKNTFLYKLFNKTIAETRQLKTLNISITRDQNMSDHFAFDRKKMHKALHDEISTYENIISAIVFLLDSVSIAMIFFTPFMATLYVRRFNTGEAIDNYYVTPNFIEIDRARALNGLPTLLPFQPIERKSIYMRRTRHIIATHFYPDRAQPRALHLYNKVLEERMRRWGMLADIQKAKFNEDVGDKEKSLLLKGMPVLAEDKQRCCRCARTDLCVEDIE
uniref:Uncharacterized protein n=1 Tax=Meloidogyne javanica TaxID=6303 RepID=A0A915MCS0_MELJA